MEELKAFWDRAEKKVIYGVLFVSLFLQVLAPFIPTLANFMDERGLTLITSLVLLVIFRYIDERLSYQRVEQDISTSTFTPGTKEVLETKRKFKTVDIFAHTGHLTSVALQDSGAEIVRLRVLLRSDDISTMQFPVELQEKQNVLFQTANTVKSLERLKKAGKIKDLQIRFYSFDPMYHFIIADGEVLHFGLFHPETDHPGTTLLNSYTALSSTPGGRRIISDFRAVFEVVWESFSKDQKATQTP